MQYFATLCQMKMQMISRRQTSLLMAVASFAFALVAGTAVSSEPVLNQSGNVLVNSDISDGDKSVPAVWEIASVPASELKMMRVERQRGDWCLAIANQHRYPRAVSNNWRQTVAENLRGQRIQLAAMLQTRDASAANVCVQCWDTTGSKLLAFASTPVVRGDNDWQRQVSETVFVPEETATVVVRAALTGTGSVWFDEVELNIIGQPVSTSGNRQEDTGAGGREREIEQSLTEKVEGRILNAYAFEKDCVILSYMENWGHGHVDHVGVANNNGGVRTLLNWNPVSDAEVYRDDLRFYAAIYSRRTVSDGAENSGICIRSITRSWPEATSWRTRPATSDDEDEMTTLPFSSDDGWQLFDLTPFVRNQDQNYGVVISFCNEQPATNTRTPQSFSGYQFVSREADGEWFAKRPVLLVVQPGETPGKDPVVVRSESQLQQGDATGDGGHQDDPAIARWIEQMGGPDDRQFEAINKLIQIGPAAAKPVSVIFGDRSETAIRRWQSAMVLGKIGGELEVAQLLEALNETGAEAGTLRAVIVEALLPRAEIEVNRKLREMAEDPETPPSLRNLVIEKLADPGLNPLLPEAWEGEFNWAESHVAAIDQAAAQNKLVMTIVYAKQSGQIARGQLDGSAMPYHTLLRGPLTDPDLKTLLENYFVLRKLSFHIHEFSLDINRPGDPLSDLGTSTRETQPPAILFHDADGILVQQFSAIGTFNSRLLHATLVRVLRESGLKLDANRTVEIPSTIPDGLRDSWVQARLYLLSGATDRAIEEIEKLISKTENKQLRTILKTLGGKVFHHDGRETEAIAWLSEAVQSGTADDSVGEAIYWLLDCKLSGEQRQTVEQAASTFQQENASSIWSRKISMRSPDAQVHMATAESFEIGDGDLLSGRPENAEVEKAVVRALDYLIRSQASDGQWRPLEGQSQTFTQIAVTAICASAIRKWRSEAAGLGIPTEMQTRLDQAEIAARAAVVRYATQFGPRQRRDYHQVWNQTYALEYLISCLENHEDDEFLDVNETTEAAQTLLDTLQRHQYAEGGWSYLPPTSAERWGGIRPHSFNTAPILMEMVKAKRAGLKVDQSTIEQAMKSLESVRSGDGTFAYAPADGFSWMTRHRCAIARDPLCELALNLAGKENRQDLVKAFERFYHHRGDLEIPRKLYASYFNTNGHGAYFYAFGYFYASEVIRYLPDDRQAKVATDIRNDLLSIVELDGTWIDSHAQGKTYATGMILRALRNTWSAQGNR